MSSGRNEHGQARIRQAPSRAVLLAGPGGKSFREATRRRGGGRVVYVSSSIRPGHRRRCWRSRRCATAAGSRSRSPSSGPCTPTCLRPPSPLIPPRPALPTVRAFLHLPRRPGRLTRRHSGAGTSRVNRHHSSPAAAGSTAGSRPAANPRHTSRTAGSRSATTPRSPGRSPTPPARRPPRPRKPSPPVSEGASRWTRSRAAGGRHGSPGPSSAARRKSLGDGVRETAVCEQRRSGFEMVIANSSSDGFAPRRSREGWLSGRGSCCWLPTACPTS